MSRYVNTCKKCYNVSSNQQAEKFKSLGNEAIQAGNFAAAIKYYSEAIALDSENAALYSNRSAVFCALKRFDQALDDADVAIKLNPRWAKVRLASRGDVLWTVFAKDILTLFMVKLSIVRKIRKLPVAQFGTFN